MKNSRPTYATTNNNKTTPLTIRIYYPPSDPPKSNHRSENLIGNPCQKLIVNEEEKPNTDVANTTAKPITDTVKKQPNNQPAVHS